MERRKFIRTCSYSVIGFPLLTSILQSCGLIYYATSIRKTNQLIVAKSEFWEIKKGKRKRRTFVMLKIEESQFPICLYKTKEDHYNASLLKCTHRGCELNVGGGIYSCPCHGSEFSIKGAVLEGPAEKDLKTFKIDTDNENIYIYLS